MRLQDCRPYGGDTDGDGYCNLFDNCPLKSNVVSVVRPLATPFEPTSTPGRHVHEY